MHMHFKCWPLTNTEATGQVLEDFLNTICHKKAGVAVVVTL